MAEQIENWRRSLQDQDRSPGTVKEYVEEVLNFLAWYEQEEGGGLPLHLEALISIALIGYRSYLQHEQQKSVSTINRLYSQPAVSELAARMEGFSLNAYSG